MPFLPQEALRSIMLAGRYRPGQHHHHNGFLQHLFATSHPPTHPPAPLAPAPAARNAHHRARPGAMARRRTHVIYRKGTRHHPAVSAFAAAIRESAARYLTSAQAS